MLEEFEKELINTIKEAAKPKNSVIRAYLGESFIFVEFVDEKYENVVERSATYNIHILACTSNKNQNYRQANKFKAYALCEAIDERLRNSNLCNEFRIEPQSAKASLNDITDYGYVYVLTRQIRTQFLEKDEFLCS